MDDTLGARIRALRVQRRITQQQLAEAAGVSVDLICKLEQGQRQSARLTSLASLANALDVTIGDLMGRPPGLTIGADSLDVTPLRRVVLSLVTDDQEPPSTDAVRAALGRLWGLYFDGRYVDLAEELPGWITAARGTVRAAACADAPAAAGLLAELLQMAAELLTHLDQVDLGHNALDAAMRAAEQAGDELLYATQQASRAWMLSRQFLWDDAGRLALAAAGQVEPRLSQASPEQAAVWGELNRYANLAQSRAGNHTEAAELLGLMRAAADRIGADRQTRYQVVRFGPTMVAMRAVDNANSREQYREALELAERVKHPHRMPPQIHSRYLLNLAWAQVQEWKNTAAVGTVLAAESVAPQAILRENIARSIVRDLLPRRRKQRLPGLAGLAERLGISTD